MNAGNSVYISRAFCLAIVFFEAGLREHETLEIQNVKLSVQFEQ